MNEEKYSYYTKFKIDSEKGLDDFWSFVIFRLNAQHDKSAYDRFARLYNLLLEHKFQLKKSVVVFLYETQDDFIIKIKTKLNAINEKIIKRLNYFQCIYACEKNAIVYNIRKFSASEKSVEPLSSSKNDKRRTVYSFISEDDMEELTNIMEKMDERDYARITSCMTRQELNDYKSSFSYFSSITQSYPQLITISNIVAELAVVLSLYADGCLERPVDARAFFQAFMANLEFWLQSIFVDGCESLDFMDASFAADFAQFKMLLGLYDDCPVDDASCSLDDIFDF